MRNPIAFATFVDTGIAAANDRPGDHRGLDQPAPRESQVTVAVPRKADGTVDTRALAAEVRHAFAAGITEIQFRTGGLSEPEVRRLLLDPDRSLLAGIGPLLPKDGVARQVRFRGAVEACVQRNEAGELQGRIEQLYLGNLTAAQRADLAREFAAAAAP